MWLLLTASFLSLLVCILLIVSTEIQYFCWGLGHSSGTVPFVFCSKGCCYAPQSSGFPANVLSSVFITVYLGDLSQLVGCLIDSAVLVC